VETNSNTAENTILRLARKMGGVRARKIRKAGLHPEYLRKLCKNGQLIRKGRGLYVLADVDIAEHHSLVEACKRVFHGIICLLSDLSYHEIGTQNPHEVWMAIDRAMRKPKADYPPIRIFRVSGPSLKEGVEEKQIEGLSVRIYIAVKFVTGCFKYRNKVGIDVAMTVTSGSFSPSRCRQISHVKWVLVC
jgi:predicted transcriptional regulator of viral defense system